MSPMGRPKVDNPKGNLIGVRLDNDTIQKLDECAEDQHTSRSEIVRQGIKKIHEGIKKKSEIHNRPKQ